IVNKARLKDFIKKSQATSKAEIVLKNGNIINVFTGEIIKADIAIDSGIIIGIGNYAGEKEIDLEDKYISPGFIDSHVHIESSMSSPSEFAKIIVPKGVTTIIADPHEIANVKGIQ